MGDKMASELPKVETCNAKDEHQALYVYLSKQLAPEMDDFVAFLTMASACLPPAILNNPKNIIIILEALEKENWIAMGNYKNLLIILEDAGLKLLGQEVKKRGKRIEEVMGKEQRHVAEFQEIQESQRLHCKMFAYMRRELVEEVTHYQSFLAVTRTFLSQGQVKKYKTNIVDLLLTLQSGNWIKPGNYNALITILEYASLNALKDEIKKQQSKIQEVMAKEKKDVQEVEGICTTTMLHCKLFEHIHSNLAKDDLRSFVTMASSRISAGTLSTNKETALEVLWILQAEKLIKVGDYKFLINILEKAGLVKLARDIQPMAQKIQECQDD